MTTEIVTFDKYSYGGESFGRLGDQRAVFAPFTIPGEQVRIQLVEEKKGYARGVPLKVLEPSPDRIDPRCPHFTRCGGCHYQHIPYEAQLEAKTEILRDQLMRIGKLDAPQIQPIVPSPNPWNYRNHIQFHLTQDGMIGFQAPRSHEIIPIKECHLPEEAINQVWPLLDLEPIPGLERIGLRSGADDDLIIILESSDPAPFELIIDLPLSVIHTGPGGSLILAGDDHNFIEIANRSFRVSAGSFFQVNTPMAMTMVEHILDNLNIPEDAILVDAYCGVGLFSAFLAPHVKQVIGIESSPSACDDYVANLDEFEDVTLYEASVGDTLPALENDPDIIILDPPRAGLDRKTMDGLLSLKPECITYISCDPATLSRDARRLVMGGYQLAQITPFDLFPQTYHIESISFWTRDSRSP
jgi:23S rRNA (uracil1939-C5)-methyltransferase